MCEEERKLKSEEVLTNPQTMMPQKHKIPRCQELSDSLLLQPSLYVTRINANSQNILKPTLMMVFLFLQRREALCYQYFVSRDKLEGRYQVYNNAQRSWNLSPKPFCILRSKINTTHGRQSERVGVQSYTRCYHSRVSFLLRVSYCSLYGLCISLYII